LNRRGVQHRSHPDPQSFIQKNMRLVPVHQLPGISLFATHPGTGIWRLTEMDGEEGDPPPPYWAYQWAGGLVLAHYFLHRPESVAGLRVLDLGAGSGIVGIAAAKAGAAAVICADVDPHAIAALGLNGAANGVVLEVVGRDMIDGPVPDVDIVAVGDLYYEQALALRVTAFLDQCLAVGIRVLVGDPGRAYLPRGRLSVIAEYPVTDFGETGAAGLKPGFIFALEAKRDGLA
jgi:predicted nicotinamide N-methyase